MLCIFLSFLRLRLPLRRFGRRYEFSDAIFLLLFHCLSHPLSLALLLCPFFSLLAQEILSTLNLQINSALLLWRRKRRVSLLALIGDFEWLSPLRSASLLEMWQKPIPALIHKFRVFGQLPLDHKLFNV